MKIGNKILTLTSFVLVGATIGSAVFAASDYQANSYGSTTYNNCYTKSGSQNGKDRFTDGSGHWILFSGISRWTIEDSTADADADILYYGNDAGGGGALSTPDLTTWTTYHGSSPAGTLSATTCGGGGGGGAGYPGYPTSSLLSIIGLPILTLQATITSSTLIAEYDANTTTQAILNELVDRTQENTFFGVILFLTGFVGVLWIIKRSLP